MLQINDCTDKQLVCNVNSLVFVLIFSTEMQAILWLIMMVQAKK